jgi:regulatory protein
MNHAFDEEKKSKPEISIRHAAMNLLARREHSFHELEQKLSARFPDEDVRSEIEKLRDENLQSDQRFLEAYIRDRASRGVGPLKIEAELYPKGFDASEVKQVLYSGDYDWQESCRQAKEKRFPQLDTKNAKEKAKCQRFLQGRGFGFDDIKGAL